MVELDWLVWIGRFAPKKMEPAQMQILADLVGGKNLPNPFFGCCMLLFGHLGVDLSTINAGVTKP